ncbi:transposase-like protein [Kribbella aluminosa]|uniref:Transposase-like protein n=1 Tax=Kribbella aluminosa TaxID=416017 RepID=A0ABS4UJ43_9ACTN|nr:transposase [Kribbella aluminosa]MBP2351682.1 transposase-like protein [Kribbella aluminosa]
MVFDKKYSDDVRERAVERVLQRRRDEPDNRSIVREVSEEFEVGPQSLRKWVARYDDGSYDYDAGDPDGWDAAPAPTQAPAPRPRKGGRRELEATIAELEHRIAVLQEDNRSLTRVVALLADELRTATNRVQHPEALLGETTRS